MFQDYLEINLCLSKQQPQPSIFSLPFSHQVPVVYCRCAITTRAGPYPSVFHMVCWHFVDVPAFYLPLRSTLLPGQTCHSLSLFLPTLPMCLLAHAHHFCGFF